MNIIPFLGENMRILYLGDIVGEQTIEVLKINLEKIKRDYKINLVLCNAENVTRGKGLSQKHYKELKSLGIAAMSMGNHTFAKSEIKEYIDSATIARPANIHTTHGKGFVTISYNQEKIILVNLLGRTFLNTPLNCPFQTMDNLLAGFSDCKIIVDFHGEATSEKKAFFYEYAGQVDAIVGSHTHVQTADEEVFKNTCYITDMGMCGPKNSILGDEIEPVIERFRTGIYEPINVSKDTKYMLNGVVLDLGIQNKIERLSLIVE